MKREFPLIKGVTWTWHGFPYAYLHDKNEQQILYTGGVNVFGQVISSMDFRTGEVKQFKLSDLSTDDHNMVATVYTDKLMVFYVGHNEQQQINYRVNSQNTDIRQLGEEKTIQASGNVSYMSALSYGNSIYLISRVGQDTWSIWYSDDSGDTWSDEKQLTVAPRSDGANYVNAGKRSLDDSEAGIVFAGHGGHDAGNYAIHFFGLDLETGDLKTMDDTVVANVKTGTGLPLSRSQGTMMYDGTNRATIQNTFGWQRFTSGLEREPMISYITYNTDWATANYEIAYWDNDTSTMKNVVVEENVNGKLLEQSHKHQFAGFHLISWNLSPKRCNLALSKYNQSSEKWEVWRYFSEDPESGEWNKEKVDESSIKLFRPVNIYNTNKNNPVNFLWLKGYFNYFLSEFSTDVKNIFTKE